MGFEAANLNHWALDLDGGAGIFSNLSEWLAQSHRGMEQPPASPGQGAEEPTLMAGMVKTAPKEASFSSHP